MKWLLDSLSVKSDVQLLHRSKFFGGLTKVSGIVIEHDGLVVLIVIFLLMLPLVIDYKGNIVL